MTINRQIKQVNKLKDRQIDTHIDGLRNRQRIKLLIAVRAGFLLFLIQGGETEEPGQPAPSEIENKIINNYR